MVNVVVAGAAPDIEHMKRVMHKSALRQFLFKMIHRARRNLSGQTQVVGDVPIKSSCWNGIKQIIAKPISLNDTIVEGVANLISLGDLL